MTEEKAIQPIWLISVASMSTISVKAAETGGSDGPTSSLNVPHSLALHASHSPAPRKSGSLVSHSPLRSPPLDHHSQSSKLSSSSSGSSSRSGSASGFQ